MDVRTISEVREPGQWRTVEEQEVMVIREVETTVDVVMRGADVIVGEDVRIEPEEDVGEDPNVEEEVMVVLEYGMGDVDGV